jgi:asparagine N-glycosylation enzyme membrane subunit Stt3
MPKSRKEFKMKTVYKHKIDFANRKILISRTFAKDAGIMNSKAYEKLMELCKAYAGYGIGILKNKKASNKQKYENLTFDKMYELIMEHDKGNAENLEMLRKVKSEHTPYPIVKKWFLEQYKYLLEKPKAMPTESTEKAS